MGSEKSNKKSTSGSSPTPTKTAPQKRDFFDRLKDLTSSKSSKKKSKDVQGTVETPPRPTSEPPRTEPKSPPKKDEGPKQPQVDEQPAPITRRRHMKPPIPPNQAALEDAQRKWEEAHNAAQKNIGRVVDNRLMDASEPIRVIKRAVLIAKGQKQKDYEDATAILNDEFGPAFERARKDAELLESLQRQVYDEIHLLEKDLGTLKEESTVIDPKVVERLADEARSKLEDAGTIREFQGVRTLIKQANAQIKVIKAMAAREGVGQDVKELLTEEDRAKVELAEATWAWESAHTGAVKTITELEKLGPLCSLDEPILQLKAAEKEAAKATTEGLQAGVSLLGTKFEPAAQEAREAAEKANALRDSAYDAVQHAELAFGKLMDLSDYVETEPAEAPVHQARDAVDSATTAEDYKNVLPLAKTAQDTIDRLLALAKPALEAEKQFEEALEAAREAAQVVANLPCSGTFAIISQPLADIRQAILAAEKAVPAPKSIMKFTQGLDKLSGVAAKRQTATDAAQAAAEVLRKMQDAEAGLTELHKYPFIDASPVEALILEAKNLLTKARDVRDAAAAGVILDKVPKAIADALEAGKGDIELVQSAGDEEIKARAVLKKMEALPNAETFSPLRHLIEAARTSIANAHEAVGKASNTQSLKNAIAAFKEVGAKRDQAKTWSEKGIEFDKKVVEADKLVAEQERHAFLKNEAKPLRAIVTKAETDLENALTLEAADSAVVPLAALEKDVEKIRKPKGVAENLKARAEYDKQRKTAGDLLASVLKLRGATKDDAIEKIIEEMETILKRADQLAGAAENKVELENATGQFVNMAKLKEKAEARAEELKKEFEADREARKRFDKVLLAAEKALAEALGLPGASDEAKRIQTLIALARATIVSDGDLSRGHAKAMEMLQDKATGFVPLLEKAQDAAASFKPDPTVVKRHKEVEDWINRLAGIASVDTADLFRSELARALEKSVKDPKAALGEMDRIANDIVAVADRLGDEEKNARKKLTELTQMLAVIDVKGFAPTEAIKRVEYAIKRSVSVEFPAREWVAATTLLNGRLEEAKEWVDLKAKYEEWTGKHDTLENMTAKCRDIAAGWPPLAGRAGKLQGEIRKLRDEVDKTRAFQLGLDGLPKLEQDFTLLENDTTAQAPQGVDLKALAKARQEGTKRVNEADEKVGRAITEFEKIPMMAGVKNKEKIGVYVTRKEIMASWATFVSGGVDQGAADVNAIHDQAEVEARKLEELAVRVRDLPSNPTGLAFALEPAIRADGEETEKGRPVQLDNMIAELERHKVDVAKDKVRLEKALKTTPVDQQELREIEADLQKKLIKAREKFEEVRQKVVKRTKWFRKKAIPRLSKSDFKEFYKKLQDKCDDFETLLASGDEDLIRQAMAEQEKLRQTLVKDLKDSKGKRFKAVQEKWKEMSNTLGEDNLVRRRLKQTYNVLYARLQDAVAKAMETDPEQSLKDLEPLHDEINEARRKALEVDARYKEFKAESEALTELHKKLTKETRTWITDKCEAFTEKLTAELAAAKGLAKTEGSMGEAFDALKEIRKELEEIRSAPDPRGALQKKDGEAEQNRRLARDLARQFESEKIAFEKLADKAEEALKKAKQDDGQVSRLRDAATGAEKIVQPYLNAISNFPHKRAQRQDADPPGTVASAFTQARKQIADLTEAAKRLIENPGSTEVADPGDLPAIEEEFRDRCRKLVTGVKELLAKVKAAAEKSSQWSATETGAPSQEAIEQTVTRLTNYFSDVHLRFSPQRLVKPLEVLKDRTTEKPARKTAREKAIREIRRMTQDMLRDDVLKELRKNPYRKLTAETSLLRASLKSLELAVLVGV